MLVRLLNGGLVVSHPFVIGELALGNIRQCEVVLDALQSLPRAVVAADEEVLHLITHQALAGRGIGYVDVHLLASARLTAGTLLWTDDRRLHAIAAELAIAFGAPSEAL
jgi:hypothetical protein